jgi:hypothetical protein
VLVDQFGVPRVRCFCGNPLLPPAEARRSPRFTGARWDGFTPAATTVIVKNTTVINTFVVVNVVDGQPFERTRGADVSKDADTKVQVPGITTTTLGVPQDVSGVWSLTAKVTGGPKECYGENAADVTMAQSGSTLTWRADNDSVTGTIDRQGRFHLVTTEQGFSEEFTGQFVFGAGGRLEMSGSGSLSGGGAACQFSLTGFKK